MSPVNPTDLRTRLAGIQTFPQLVAFLRDDMGWPIERESFEDLVFDFTPEELGIDAKNAAKIQEIRRLRPLSSNQPWGVFFVKFEPKRLPVVALRRILSSVAIKKRASANAADRAAWRVDDLLFLSSYGEGEERQISFAHFAAPKEGDDLPALKVLGWDNLDTLPHLDAVARALSQHLAWPSDEPDREVWRERWRAAFTLRHREVITTSKELSLRLAELARAIHDRIVTALKVENEKGPLTKLMGAFRDALVHDLKPDGFADMYAQTITYGLLSARIADPTRRTADDFAAHMRTSPFLRELMEHFLRVGGRKGKAGGPGIDFDELGVADVVDLLDSANMEAVVADFGDKNQKEDPVIHFYEHFLAAYNKKLKAQRGVFYTPQPVVSYIVRSVHELLQSEFGLADGLADTTTWGEMVERNPGLKLPPLTDDPGETRTIAPDSPFVQILDPATGTATFLVEVIDVIFRTLKTKWATQGATEAQQRDAWNAYVPHHLLPRLHAYELMMAPYAIAHMKVCLKLAETGYRFGSAERARIFLTNALEPWQRQLRLPAFAALAHEAEAVNEVKRDTRFTVVVGNPPYAQYSMNLNEKAKAHIERFRYANGQKLRLRNPLQLERNLNDDYVKFVGFSSGLLPLGTGVLGLITNRMFLDSESLVGLREWLARNFSSLQFVDLRGSGEEARRVARLSGDENVFDILQGVAISFAVRRVEGERVALAKYREVTGARESKYHLLSTDLMVTSAEWSVVEPAPDQWRMDRQEPTAVDSLEVFSLSEIFKHFSTLVGSNRDHLVVNFEQDVVVENVEKVKSFRGSNEEWSQRFGITLKSNWNVDAARRSLAGVRDVRSLVKPIEYRAFDRRWIFFHPALVWQTAPISSGSVLRSPGNRILIALGRSRAETVSGQWVSSTIADKSVVGTRDNASGFPLFVLDEDDGLDFGAGRARPNLTATFLRRLAALFGLRQVGPFGMPEGITPEVILGYVYGVLYSPEYRGRYAERLVKGFPPVPIASSLALFRALADLGSELVALHTLEAQERREASAGYFGGRMPEVEMVSWAGDTVFVDKDQTAGFRGVRNEVWSFHVGEYQVCEKWLRDRKGRRLSQEDIEHYQKIVVAISETIRIMKEIDEVIERHGGWPGAFQTGKAKAQVAVPRALPFRPRRVEPAAEERYVTCVPLLPLKVAAGAFGEAQPALDEETEWVGVPSRHRLRPGMFVAEVVGKSMEPEIPDGSYCLFRAPVEGTRQDRVVLAELRDAVDPESGERYTVKRYESEKREVEGSWRHASVTLRPANPEFQPIVLDVADEERMRVVAELVAVLGPDDTSQPCGTGGATAFDGPAKPGRPSARRRGPQEARQGSLLELVEAVPDGGAGSPAEEPDRDELICSIRQLLGDGRSREREALIQELAREAGYGRVEPGVRDALEGAVRTAARRGVIRSERDEVALLARAITDYERAFLKEQFLASLGGRAWRTRDEAIRAFARWMGFRRTGKVIQETGRSLITSLLRAGALEAGKDGLIRRA
jgi:SOS-response transcriptional repressor LexA